MSTAVLAQNNFGDTESGGMVGPMGLLIIVLLVIATVLLIRNMNSRLRRLSERFPSPDAEPPTEIVDQVPSGTAQSVATQQDEPLETQIAEPKNQVPR